jgi:hypothetical protein
MCGEHDILIFSTKCAVQNVLFKNVWMSIFHIVNFKKKKSTMMYYNTGNTSIVNITILVIPVSRRLLHIIPSLAAASRVHPLCNLQSRAQAHVVLVIGLYELLGKTRRNR